MLPEHEDALSLAANKSSADGPCPPSTADGSSAAGHCPPCMMPLTGPRPSPCPPGTGKRWQVIRLSSAGNPALAR
eukprot:3718468-Alexandrium_andersonii.AAC.1